MVRTIVLMLALLVLVTARGETATPVVITKRAPIQPIDATGNVIGVTEANVGDKFTLVSFAGGRLTLEDAKGNRYLIAVDATDYVPLSAGAPPVQPAPSAVPPPASAPASALALVPPRTLPDAGKSAIDGLPADGDLLTVEIGDRASAKDMSAWPPKGIANRPLLVAAHGNGGAGPREIRGWLPLARSHNFTIVCPSFLSSVHTVHLPEDEPYFNDCIKWMKDNLQFDHANVFMVGFSGGGFPTWYLGTKHPEFFRGLAFQSGNFAGGYYGLDLHKWFNRPIELIWGTQDLADIPGQNQNAVAALKAEDCKDYATEIVPGGSHQEHPDLVVAWMEKNLAATDPDSR